MASFTGLLVLILIGALILSIILSFMKKVTRAAIWVALLALLVVGGLHLLKGIA